MSEAGRMIWQKFPEASVAKRGKLALQTFEDYAVGYEPSRGLVEAVKVALYLGKPLILSGESGSGKTSVAYSVARQFKLEPVRPGIQELQWWPG